MKKLFFSLFLTLIIIQVNGQLQLNWGLDTIHVIRAPRITQSITANVLVQSPLPAAANSTIAYVALVANPASPLPAGVLQIGLDSFAIVPGSSSYSIPLTINQGSQSSVQYATIELRYNNGTVQRTFMTLKLTGPVSSNSVVAQVVPPGQFIVVKDTTNYVKAEIIQYNDILGIKNDRPNGLLQYQGLVKIPLNMKRRLYSNGYTTQWFRSFIVDVTINRVDKSKTEIDYDYTAFLLENNSAKKTANPWLATMDIWRYSNFQAGIRLVPFAVEMNNFRIQLQAGYKVLKNLPFSADTIRSGVDSGKVKSDFRSVYSGAKFVELYVKTIKMDHNVEFSMNTGFMWLKLMDSYYQQIDVYQQDPFQRSIALTTLNSFQSSRPIWYNSIRLGFALGEEKLASTFLRLNYMLQKGRYLKPLGTILDGQPVQFEERNFYNNFFQVHIGLTLELDKILNGAKNKSKNDGTISNSVI